MISLRVPGHDEIVAGWNEFTGGPPVVGALGHYQPGDVEAVALDDGKGGSGLATWAIQGGTAELVSIHTQTPGRGLGRVLLLEFERRAKEAGAHRAVIITTNDNVEALRFYLREGYRLVRLRLDAMDRVRELKPTVPRTGNGGMPLQDQWEMEKLLEP